MRPELDQIFASLFETMALRILPDPATPYAAGNLGVIATMMVCAAQTYDTGVDQRVGDIKTLRALFDDAAAHVDDQALKAELESAAQGTTTSLKISALDQEQDKLLELLIALQIWCETNASEPARQLEGRALAFLKSSAEARAIKLPTEFMG